AAQKAEAHAATPAVTYLDALGRTFLTLASNGPAVGDFFRTLGDLDIQGHQRAGTGALDRRAMTYDHDVLGIRLHQDSLDAGHRWMLSNAAGKPERMWDQLGRRVRHTYDALLRPTLLFVQAGSDPERLAERVVYGEGEPNADTANLRGAIFQ